MAMHEVERDLRMRSRGFDYTCDQCLLAYANDPDHEDEAWAENYLKSVELDKER